MTTEPPTGSATADVSRMGALVRGHIEYRTDGEWHHDHVIWDLLIGGRGHAYLFGIENDYPDIPHKLELAPRRGYPQEMTDTPRDDLELWHESVAEERVYDGDETYLTAADLDRLDRSLIGPQWEGFLTYLIELGTQYGPDNARAIVLFIAVG